MPDIKAALDQAQAHGLDRLDSQLLLLHALDLDPAQASTRRAWLLAHGDDVAPTPLLERFHGYVQRRLEGEPLAYITGQKEFFGLNLKVDARVLVPRPDTETLAGWALELLSGPITARFPMQLSALDLGTGSGAIALAIKHQMPDVQVDALDASDDALTVARANARELGLQVAFNQGFWLDGVTRQYHCIVSNPPYVAAGDPHLPALAHEPPAALVSGVDGLQDLRQIVNAAPSRLHSSGWLVVEHGYDQGTAVRALFAAAGYRGIETRRDLGGQERCTAGHIP